MKKPLYPLVMLFTLVVALFWGCAAPQANAPSGSSPSSEAVVVKVGVNPVPGGEILGFVRDKLAEPEGLKVEVVEFADYVQPNIALNEKQIDANFFQHIPYMEDFGKQHSIDMVAVSRVLIAPLGIYSSQLQALSKTQENATIAIPNDAVNLARALRLLEANHLLKLKSGAGVQATVRDIAENPKKLQIRELEAAQLPRSLADVDLAVINVNYALQANLNPAKDALALESPQNNPYVNVLAVLKGRETDANIQKLGKLLTSTSVKQFIEEKYRGTLIPAF
jgi:D-methionine transport system substrate-binding protein